MELEDAEHFVYAAEEDYQQRAAAYRLIVWDNESGGVDVDVLREARADVLAAQQVLMLARDELRWQQTVARQQAVEQEKRAAQGEEGR